MNKDSLSQIIEKLESKQKDCVSFSKKFEKRDMQDLFQYYEGANWALKFAISLLKDKND